MRRMTAMAATVAISDGRIEPTRCSRNDTKRRVLRLVPFRRIGNWVARIRAAGARFGMSR